MSEFNGVTADVIKTTAPDLTDGMSDDTIKALLQDAAVNTLADGFPKPDADGKDDEITTLATKYLALHMATMDSPSGQGITSEKVASLSKTYESRIGKDWLHSSVWGLLYYRLWRLYGGGTGRWAVVQH